MIPRSRKLPQTLVALSMWLLLAHAAYGAPVGFLFFGDFGMGNDMQRQVASTMVRFCASEQCQFVLGLGDNFYPHGVSSADDPQFQEKFEKPYGPLGLVFYPTFGNHDYDGNIQAQLDYSGRSRLWAFPSHYYQFNRDNVDFFAVDTEDFSIAQMSWLNSALSMSTATWKIVYGHRPIFSFGKHGHAFELWPWLLPLLKWYDVDLYVSGHDHNRQIIRGNGITYVVSGAASDPTKILLPNSSAVFSKTGAGFGYMEIDGKKATIKMVDDTGKIDFEHVIEKS